jgi:hypothetical protein
MSAALDLDHPEKENRLGLALSLFGRAIRRCVPTSEVAASAVRDCLAPAGGVNVEISSYFVANSLVHYQLKRALLSHRWQGEVCIRHASSPSGTDTQQFPVERLEQFSLPIMQAVCSSEAGQLLDLDSVRGQFSPSEETDTDLDYIRGISTSENTSDLELDDSDYSPSDDDDEINFEEHAFANITVTSLVIETASTQVDGQTLKNVQRPINWTVVENIATGMAPNVAGAANIPPVIITWVNLTNQVHTYIYIYKSAFINLSERILVCSRRATSRSWLLSTNMSMPFARSLRRPATIRWKEVDSLITF